MKNREEILNELLLLSNKQQELWDYHPDNPNGISLIAAYNDITKAIEILEESLK